MRKEINSKLAMIIVLLFALAAASCMSWAYQLQSNNLDNLRNTLNSFSQSESTIDNPNVDFKKFSSEEDFKSYIEEAQKLNTSSYGGMGGGMAIEKLAPSAVPNSDQDRPVSSNNEEASNLTPDRISSTNVQVVGVDEPDIVKTNGKEIYFSPQNRYYYLGAREDIATEKLIMPPRPNETVKTKVINAFPPSDLKIYSEIGQVGDLLLSGNDLVVFSGDKIYGYNVSDSKNPQKIWEFKIESGSSIVGSRLLNGKIYLTLSSSTNYSKPCPIRPLTAEGVDWEIKCADVYHPGYPVSVEAIYSVFALNPETGKIEKSVSFVGPIDSSLIYVSLENIYVSYYTQGGHFDFLVGFFNEKCKDLVPSSVLQKLNNLAKYDISEQAKLVEFEVIFQKYQGSLDKDETLRIENEFSNRMQDYYSIHKRDLEKTRIVKVGIKNFVVLADGEIPGRLLNQFSMDEYQGNLRTAVTVGGSWLNWGAGGTSGNSANDVYILDYNLDITGSVKDLGLQERIYSVRFLGDKGYLVTFKNTDPFYVMDLSNPQKPAVVGELKIPGFSSYLHSIGDDKILGIGREQSKVKISLFDVKDPANPREIAKYLLDEYWTEVSSNHHAFLLDTKHSIFFLPGGQGGYIFSYKDDGLKLVKAVSDNQVKRAIYLDDYLYIIGEEKITVLNETDWTKAGGLVF